MTSEWVVDDALGVAVREVGRDKKYLQVRPTTTAGRKRIYAALSPLSNHKWFYGSERIDLPLCHNIIEIDPAHRLAFAQALLPIEAFVAAPTSGDRIRALREEIGPCDFDIVGAIRELRDGDAADADSDKRRIEELEHTVKTKIPALEVVLVMQGQHIAELTKRLEVKGIG